MTRDPYRLWNDRFVQFSVAAGAASAQAVSSIAKTFNPPEFVPVLLAVVTVLVFMVFGSRLLLLVFSMSRVLRQALLGSAFIEGTWLEVTYRSGTPVGFAITEIRLLLGRPYFEGVQYNLKLEKTATFESFGPEVRWPIIDYMYVNTPLDRIDKVSGMCTIHFQQHAATAPTEFTGEFDPSQQERHKIEGIKITADDALAKLTTSDGKLQLLKELRDRATHGATVTPPQPSTAPAAGVVVVPAQTAPPPPTNP